MSTDGAEERDTDEGAVAGYQKTWISPALWVVIKDFPHSLIIKGRITGEFRLINK